MLFLKIYYSILFLIFKKTFPKNISNLEIGNYCEDGAACGIHGNCNINIFEKSSIENSFMDLFNYTTHCYCHYGYSTYNVKSKIAKIDPTTNNDLNDIIELSDIRCCYEQKKQIMGFLLEMFTGLGIGHFYLGNYLLGSFKLCLNFFLYVIICCGVLIICNNDKNEEYFYNNNNNNIYNNIYNNNNNNNNANGIVVNNLNNDNNNNNFIEENEIHKIYNKLLYIILMCCCLLFLVYFIDLLLLGIGVQTDGYGQPLRMW